jgi:hypothetical protein
MNRIVSGSAIVLALFAGVAEAASTMRVDYYHTGNHREEHFSLDRVVVEPREWPGHPAHPVDATNRGTYLFEVVDAGTGRLLFSRGFSSIYGEWETTAEARSMNRTFSESLRFPAVERPARIILKKRDEENVFREVWTFTIDPRDLFVQRGVSVDAGTLIAIHEAGDPTEKLDLLFLGDGYTAGERDKFERDARRLTAVLFGTSPFRERQTDINVWGLLPIAAESGVSEPSRGVYRRSPLGTAYDAFGLERYVLTFENRALRDIAASAPYDVIQVLANSASYGGGGIHGLYSIVAADNVWAPYLFVHEFGHHLAGLADEYYTSDVAYLPAPHPVEPWEPNVTVLRDPSRVKWIEFVTEGTPIPTPWPKEAYEQHATEVQELRRRARAEGRPEPEIDALLREELQQEATLLGSSQFAARVGAFEGANYAARGFFRPEVDCIMFSRSRAAFCHVCREAIQEILDLYSRG